MRAKVKGDEQPLDVVAYSSKTFTEKSYVGTRDIVKPVIILKTRGNKENKQKLVIVDIDEVEYVD